MSDPESPVGEDALSRFHCTEACAHVSFVIPGLRLTPRHTLSQPELTADGRHPAS